MIVGFEYRWQVEAQLAALEREKGSGHMNPAWLRRIEDQEAIFRAELERIEREGDYGEPKPPPRKGAFAWVGDQGKPLFR